MFSKSQPTILLGQSARLLYNDPSLNPANIYFITYV